MDLVRLYASYLFEASLDENTSDVDDQAEVDEQSSGTLSARKSNAGLISQDGHDANLDYDGPRLLDGCRWWVRFYQLTGHISWFGWPLSMAILYRVALFSAVLWAISPRTASLFNIESFQVALQGTLFSATFALSAVLGQFIIHRTLYVGLFDSVALKNILFTPKLCYLKTDVLKTIGDKTLSIALAFAYYHILLHFSVTYNTWNELKNDFGFRMFLIEVPLIVIMGFYVFIASTHLDFYIRTCFAIWLLGLRRTLKYKSINKFKSKLRVIDYSPTERSESMTTLTSSTATQDACQLLTLDDIIKSLNEMDNHLEALRNTQMFGIVTLTLNTYLGTGCVLLLSHITFAIQDDYFHGAILCLMTVNFSVNTFFIYFGDSFILYALNRLAQLIEDEFYMQKSDNEINSNESTTGTRGERSRREAIRVWRNCECSRCQLEQREELRSFRITKNDVMFFREFLHQFKEHLATPWSQLNAQAHSEVFLAFVTLTAIQIMLAHEY